MRPEELVGSALILLLVLLVARWLAAVTGRTARRRLRRLRIGPTSARDVIGPAVEAPAGDASHRWIRPDRIRLVTAVFGVSVALALGGSLGAFTGAVLAVGADHVLRRVEPSEVRARRRREAADLPLATDLVAAALRAGAPVDRAVTAVAETLGGPLSERMHRVGRTLRLGGEPEEAWAHLGHVDGADRVAAAAIRSATSGASLAGTLLRIADDLRADRATAAEAAARRAGVLIVLPLGLCFLPAFILAGLVPVIVAVLGDVL
ncbi:type II secretion system F family protein [Plantactinospora sp. GCM10030261]|uniref:type II secretion system F family protein n=1 Tax=Plantactinospora sp. GCM10030261 TaxID=3273420 RepID=UPI003623A742